MRGCTRRVNSVTVLSGSAPRHWRRTGGSHMRLRTEFSMRRGRGIAAAGATVAIAVATFGIALSAPAGAAPGCRVDYSASNWGGGGGFTANLHVTNLGDPVNGWTLAFTYPGSQRVTMPGWS